MNIHRMIQYYRQVHMHTLKSLAQEMGMSSRTLSNIEKGHAPSPQSFEKIQSVIPYCTKDAADDTWIQSQLHACFKAIIYVEYAEAGTLIEALNDQGLEYSAYTIPWTLYKYMFAIHTQDTQYDLDELDHQLSYLMPYMNATERDIYFVEQSGYYFLKGDLKKSATLAKRSLNEVEDAHLRAINLFLLGASGINEIGQIEEATHYLEDAENIFLKFANYKRARRCQAFQLTGMIHGHRYDEVMQHYHALKQSTAQNASQLQLDAFIDGTLARYYTFIGDFLTALNLLHAIPFKSSINYFLMLYNYYQTENWDALKTHIKAIKDWQEPINNAVHQMCVQAIDSYVSNPDIQALAGILEKAFDLALETGDYLSIMLVSNVTIDALKKAKRYKDAYHLASQKLSILRENT